MKKILFPFELDNPFYKEAYVYGIKFARNIHAELIVLNVFKLEVGDDITKDEYENLKKLNWFNAYNEICRFNNYYLKEHVNPGIDLRIRFNYRFIHGVLYKEVRNICRQEPIDLVVLPLSNQKAFNKRQLRIIHDNILGNKRTSFLVVPFQCIFRPIKNIILAVDYQIQGARYYMDEVLKITKAFDANLHFIHVGQKVSMEGIQRTEAFKEMTRIVEKSKRYVSKFLEDKHVVEGVCRYVEEQQGDLLIVVRHQHYFLDKIFHDSVSDKISYLSSVPVLVMSEYKP